MKNRLRIAVDAGSLYKLAPLQAWMHGITIHSEQALLSKFQLRVGDFEA